jgi:hypothetical protein
VGPQRGRAERRLGDDAPCPQRTTYLRKMPGQLLEWDRPAAAVAGVHGRPPQEPHVGTPKEIPPFRLWHGDGLANRPSGIRPWEQVRPQSGRRGARPCRLLFRGGLDLAATDRIAAPPERERPRKPTDVASGADCCPDRTGAGPRGRSRRTAPESERPFAPLAHPTDQA